METFAKFLEIDTFPSIRSLENLQPILDKINSMGYDVHVQNNCVSIWKNFHSRGYRQIQMSINDNVTDAYYDCCSKFISMICFKNSQQ